jgi:hypothetical protein
MAKSKKSASGPQPKSDAYVGLLILSLLAQIAGAVFLYLEYSSYPESGVPRVQASPSLQAAAPNPNPGPPPNPNPMPMPMPMPPMNP